MARPRKLRPVPSLQFTFRPVPHHLLSSSHTVSCIPTCQEARWTYVVGRSRLLRRGPHQPRSFRFLPPGRVPRAGNIYYFAIGLC
jgi:hypothetical protein